jgi:putative transposase
VVRQGYYRWLAQGPCERERTDAELTDVTCEIHAGLDGRPGVGNELPRLVTSAVVQISVPRRVRHAPR